MADVLVCYKGTVEQCGNTSKVLGVPAKLLFSLYEGTVEQYIGKLIHIPSSINIYEAPY